MNITISVDSKNRAELEHMRDVANMLLADLEHDCVMTEPGSWGCDGPLPTADWLDRYIAGETWEAIAGPLPESATRHWRLEDALNYHHVTFRSPRGWKMSENKLAGIRRHAK